MIHIQKKVQLNIGYDLRELSADGRPLFMDIETTGLSAERNHVYLIGCCCPAGEIDCQTEDLQTETISADNRPIDECTWEFHQWFSRFPAEEEEIIRAFHDYAERFSVMVHFNGDTFDLPFLHRRAEKLKIEEEFMTRPGVDILKRCRKLKRLLNTPDIKLKTLEAFLGIDREDRYTGGQLIEVYRRYSKHMELHPETGSGEDREAEHLLLLHNEEDILGMAGMLPILTYDRLLRGDYRVLEMMDCRIAGDGSEGRAPMTFTADFRLNLMVPQPVFFEEGCWKGILRKDRLRVTCPLCCGEKKKFFDNYRDYYYLPEEDTAMHKSVASFVDKDYRQKATRETAYVRKTGIYLPMPGEEMSGAESVNQIPYFRDNPKGEPYADLETLAEEAEKREGNREFWDQYVHRLTGRIH